MRPPPLATILAACLGILAAYSGGWLDEIVNFTINVFLVIPTIPLLIVASAYLKQPRHVPMILILGLTLWAFEARILRGQALTLRNRDFILAAKVAGEPTWRIVLFELMPNMISRIAAAFVLVFYVTILTAAGLEFLGLGDLSTRAGASRSTGRRSTRPCCRASGGHSSSRVSRSRSRSSRSSSSWRASTRSATRSCARRSGAARGAFTSLFLGRGAAE